MKTDKKIIDVCCSGRMFWFDKQNPDVLFSDIREEEHLFNDGHLLKIKPDVVADFRNLPFDDKQFKLVVFDPPHVEGLQPTSIMAKKYGVLSFDWRTHLKEGFNERIIYKAFIYYCNFDNNIRLDDELIAV